ncbi:MAG: Wzt carbohydrate-binding domain-containing protein, partial [Actinomycetota bacterium]|nr:Wzt carbohydrate-binding domain-containing protein [Actinomycetota bacterium]
RNGSGKSTLLKCMAGIYGLSSGRMYVNGSLSTFIELGVGFNPDLPAYDNVVVNGIMLGLTPREARRRFDAVIDFAELHEFLDLKLKNYSSGMHVRLAFSVMIQVDAEILLIDEVLAVGDAAFQQKCFDVFHDLRARGRTILFVTHDMGAVERFCDRALLLERGGLVDIGDPTEVAAKYVELNFRGEAGAAGAGDRGGDGGARIEDAWVDDAAGERKTVLMQGEHCTVRSRVRFHAAVEDPEFRLAWINQDRQNHFVVSSAVDGEATGRFEPGDEAEVAVAFDNSLGPGRYFLSMVVARPGGGQDMLDRWEQMFSVVVVGPRAAGGLVDLPHRLTVQRRPASAPAPVEGASR